jgi:hypothetical protein
MALPTIRTRAQTKRPEPPAAPSGVASSSRLGIGALGAAPRRAACLLSHGSGRVPVVRAQGYLSVSARSQAKERIPHAPSQPASRATASFAPRCRAGRSMWPAQPRGPGRDPNSKLPWTFSLWTRRARSHSPTCLQSRPPRTQSCCSAILSSWSNHPVVRTRRERSGRSPRQGAPSGRPCRHGGQVPGPGSRSRLLLTDHVLPPTSRLAAWSSCTP